MAESTISSLSYDLIHVVVCHDGEIMINEEVDEIGADEADEAIETNEPVPVVDRPVGSWAKTFAGREIWFKPPSRGQIQALKRAHTVFSREVEAASEDEDVERLRSVVGEFNDMALDLVDSMYLYPEDRKFILGALVRGEVEPGDLMGLLFGNDEPDDDEEPVPVKPKGKPKGARPAQAKKAANASRTRR